MVKKHSSAGTPQLSAGGVVFRAGRSGTEILLGEQIDWNTREQTVRLPKGHLDDGESLEDAALREVREETGRRATLCEQLDEVNYAYRDHRTGELIVKRVVFFLMEDAGADPAQRDDEMERVYWSPIDEAARELSFETERRVVRKAAERLARGDTG